MRSYHSRLILAALFSLILGATLRAQSGARAAIPVGPVSPAPSTAEFAPFRPITELNIFNSARVGRVTAAPKTAAPPPPPPQPQTITLVGTLASEKGNFAFFDSSEDTYRQVLPVEKTLAGFRITKIDTDTVQLSRGEDVITLNVRDQLQRAPDSPWKLSDSPVPTSRSSSASSSSTVDRSTPAAPANASDALKRLMERRRQRTSTP